LSFRFSVHLIVVFVALTGGFGSTAPVADAAGIDARHGKCHAADPCRLDRRSYHALLPDNWDGVSAMPVLVHFHGWGRQGTLIVKHGRIAGATRKTGVLLLAPNGDGRTWDFWDADTADVDFTNQVIEDAARRWPIDRARIFVSGYSYGSAMAWRYACAEGSKVRALLAVSGSFRNVEAKCPGGPVEVRHVHGTDDGVMDFPFGPRGEKTWPVELWRRQNGCGEKPDRISNWHIAKWVPFTRHVWTSCSSGKPVILDVHPRGHFIPTGWIRKQLDELLQ
jgi:polyhydroxybutyrate depolymerase